MAPHWTNWSPGFARCSRRSRGTGLIQGLKCVVPAADVQAAFTAEGLLSVVAGENVVRLVPPLVVTDADLGDGDRDDAPGCGALFGLDGQRAAK